MRPLTPWPKSHTLSDQGKNFKNNVEVGGIEPPSFSFSMGLLRAQPVFLSRVARRYRQLRATPAQ